MPERRGPVRAIAAAPATAQFSAGMDELTARFRMGLQERLEALSGDREAVTRDPAARSRVRGAAHALKGSGGTYGFPDISAAAGAVEVAPDDGIAPALDRLLASLRRALASPAAGSGALDDEALRERLAALRAALGAGLADAAAAGGADAGAQIGAADGDGARVLIVDDDPDVSRLLAAVLAAPGRRIAVHATAAEAERAARAGPVGLIVLDLMLPDADGRSLLARLREDPSTAAVPVIVLSGHAAAQARNECYALGAEAFIVKPFDPAAVAGTVTAILERAPWIGRDARLDPVTSLPSRVAFREAFARATGSGAGPPPSVTIALLELDQYRPLAAASGWGSADRALAFAARVLAAHLPGTTLLARWSGGAFAALLAGSAEPGATAAVAAALRDVREEAPPAGVADRFTFSAGVAEWAQGTSLDDTLAEAESRLAAARGGGGDALRSSARPAAADRRVVVLAEDDDLIASVVTHRLERDGLAVRHYRDGAAAAAAAPGLRPALVILDVKMPGMDGFEVLGRLRADAALASTPIMMLTSMGSEQDVVRGLALGADDYVVKPFSPVEVVARVHRLLLRK